MRNLVLAIGLFGMAACGKSKCEKYADMEVKCGGIPDKEADMTRALAQGMCSESDKVADKDPMMKEMAQRFQKEADCAEKATECSAYKACTDALK